MFRDTEFIPGRKLSRMVSQELEPKLRRMFPNTPLTLAFIGAGSDVTGYDSVRSMDHDWGPRITIVVNDHLVQHIRDRINREIISLLSDTVCGFPTRFRRHEDGTLFPDTEGTIHRIEVTSIEALTTQCLLISDHSELTDAVWLSTPMQSLLELTSGEVFVDDSGALTQLREALAFYPDHIWRYQLAGLWKRVSQMNPFIGRTGEVGDNTGSAQIAAGISRDLMTIALLQSRNYAPYPKWLGTAFARLDVAEQVGPHLEKAASSRTWKDRETAINAAGTTLVRQFNALQLMPHVNPEPISFHSRPFYVLPAETIVEKLLTTLEANGLASLPAIMGGIDVITDSTDARGSREFRHAVRAMFETAIRG